MDDLTRTAIDDPSDEYVKINREVANPVNIVTSVYNGHQTIPTPYGANGWEIMMSGLNGSIRSPSPTATIDQYNHYVLKLPDDIAEVVGNGSLLIQLKIKAENDDIGQS